MLKGWWETSLNNETIRFCFLGKSESPALQALDYLGEDDVLQGGGHPASQVRTHIVPAFSAASLGSPESKNPHESEGWGSEFASRTQ